MKFVSAPTLRSYEFGVEVVMPIAKLIQFRGEVLAHKIVQLKLGDLKIFILCGLLLEVSSKQASKLTRFSFVCGSLLKVKFRGNKFRNFTFIAPKLHLHSI